MTSCANITIEKIRAEITIGDKTFVTPDIKSFNVTRSRSQLASSFSASIEVPVTQKFATGEQVVIRAGTEGNEQTIFTGSVRTVTVNPSFERATTYVINLSGADKFQELEGKNLSRRQRSRQATSFAAITSITKKPQKGISYDVRMGGQGGSARVQSETTNVREHSKVVNTDRPSYNPLYNTNQPGSANADSATGTGSTSGVDLTIVPAAIAIPTGGSVLFTINPNEYAAGDTWAVSDTEIGTIIDRANGTAVYTQLALGENIITYRDTSAGTSAVAAAVGIPIHDHSDLGQGGPAFGVYASE